VILRWPFRLFDSKGDWFFTLSGRRQWVRAPNVEDIVLEDIAEPLAKLCRFNGQCRGFYSVAQHAVLVSHLVPPHLAFDGLNHDDTEGYLGDVIRPVKAELRRYKKLERIWEPAVAQRFGLQYPMPAEVKKADLLALAWERRDLAPWCVPEINPTAWRWKMDELAVGTVGPEYPPIVPLEWQDARDAFLVRFHELNRAREREVAA
jgi:hypothetical protein